MGFESYYLVKPSDERFSESAAITKTLQCLRIVGDYATRSVPRVSGFVQTPKGLPIAPFTGCHWVPRVPLFVPLWHDLANATLLNY